ncbi:alpha/beta hydrolase [Polluticoccus soli]|uniref:alpha/beta hydrolase n=1 Tax=Polluticoccus soli TaxID=3034150 RepID=UPI0023E2E009|nr:alpha/beta hydrolase [Flavipsychrobacter sp. JY13-12]
MATSLRTSKTILFLFALLFVHLSSFAQRYVFYLHGTIVEGTTTDPISESYGRYEYANIIKALKQYGYVVISERRAANTIVESYALKVASQIDSLKKTGVKSDNITVIGASKGAGIAMRASGFAKDKKVKYVLMAGCNDEDAGRYDLYGQILSIYEKSDPFAGSCNAIKKRSPGVSKYKEIELTTGKKHGFIYTPISEWLIPAVNWIEK